MLTLVIDSDLMPAMTHGWSQLALVCGVAVADTVAAIVGEIDCQLKWPNDVYVRGRKIAGILIETVRLPARTPANGWLIGIGLNVNMDWSAAPEELAARATCLSRETQCGYDPEEVLMELVEQLEGWLGGWRNGSLHWLNGWRERCLLTGKIIQVRLAHSPSDVSQPAMLLGRCEGVDTQGRLLVRQEQGVQSLSVGEVIHWQS